MKRTFIAVKVNPGPKLNGLLEKFRGELKEEPIKWVDTGKMHITLAFIGDTSENTIRDISVMLGDLLRKQEKISFNVKGAGVFKSMHDPKVIWAGVTGGELLTKMADGIRKGLEKLDVTVEERDFRPHLTLGRIRFLKNKKSLEKLLELYKNELLQEVVISEVIYYESILQPAGPLYIPIKTFRLSGDTTDD